MSTENNGLESLFQQLEASAQQGRLDEADALSERILALDAGHPGTLYYLGARALNGNDFDTAAARFRGALERDPDNLRALFGLALAAFAQQRLVDALDILDRSASLDGEQAHVFLYRGVILEGLERREESVAAFMRGLGLMRRLGWVPTEPRAQVLVAHAEVVVAMELDRRFDEALAGLRDRHGPEALQRIREGADFFVGKTPVKYADERQQPGLFYVPGLPAQLFFERESLPWVAEVEAAVGAIRDEMHAVVTDGEDFHLVRNGEPVTANLERCPATAALIESLDLHRVPGYSPQVLFSTLAADATIPERRGPVNARIVIHLPLAVATEGCELRVGGETRSWEPGRVLAFDDTFVHSARNAAGDAQVALVFDIWNPHLTEVEREAFVRVLTTAQDFEREMA